MTAPSTPRPWLASYDSGVPASLDYVDGPLYGLLDDAADQWPTQIGVVGDGQDRATYAELRRWTDSLAGALRRLGFGRDTRVALLLPTGMDFVVAYFGALKCGATVVPLNPQMPDLERQQQLERSAAHLVVAPPPLAERVRSGDGVNAPVVIAADLTNAAGPVNRAGPPSLTDLITGPAHAPDPIDTHDVALLMPTGGTTGTTKLITLTHAQCLANAHQVAAWGHLQTTDRILVTLPLFHGFGMGVTMNAPLLRGAQLILMPAFAPARVLETIEQAKPTFMIGVPTMFATLSTWPGAERHDLSSLQGVFVGGAPLSPAIKERFEMSSGARMIEGYGLTESVTAVMANPYRGRHKAGSVGIPFPDVEAKVCDASSGVDLPPGQQGEIVLRSPSVMLGYDGDAEATARALRGGWLHTGDLGWMDEDGYFYITDRLKDIIITGGFNVVPREVEAVLERHPQVMQAAVVGLPDERRGERIEAHVVLGPDRAVTVEDLLTYLGERLLPYKVPTAIRFHTSLPTSAVGKVLRRRLRAEGHTSPAED